MWGKRVRRGAGSFASHRDGQQLPRGGGARAIQLKLREDVGFHGVKSGMVMLGAIWILRISLMRTVGRAMIAVVARGILRFDGACTQRAGGGAGRTIEKSDNHEGCCCEFCAHCGERHHKRTISLRSGGRKEAAGRESPW